MTRGPVSHSVAPVKRAMPVHPLKEGSRIVERLSMVKHIAGDDNLSHVQSVMDLAWGIRLNARESSS